MNARRMIASNEPTGVSALPVRRKPRCPDCGKPLRCVWGGYLVCLCSFYAEATKDKAGLVMLNHVVERAREQMARGAAKLKVTVLVSEVNAALIWDYYTRFCRRRAPFREVLTDMITDKAISIRRDWCRAFPSRGEKNIQVLFAKKGRARS